MYFVSMRHFDLGLGFHSRRLCILDTKKEKRGAGPRSDKFCVGDSAAAADGETPSGVKAGGREAAEIVGKVQADVAAALKIKQPSISKIEKQSEIYLATLRAM